MSQQWDQGRNQKIPWKKLKWGYNNPKSWDTGKENLRRKQEIHSITCLTKKRWGGEAQINNLTSHLKGLEKEQ